MTAVTNTYRSPFGDPSTDHNTPNALCITRSGDATAMRSTLIDYSVMAIHAIDQGIPQPAFFLARQFAELSVKALLGPNHKQGHNLVKLLDELEQRGDDLFTGTDKGQPDLVEFIRDLNKHDPRGDEGRYPTSHGQPSLSGSCCANPAILREHVGRLQAYVLPRVSW